MSFFITSCRAIMFRRQKARNSKLFHIAAAQKTLSSGNEYFIRDDELLNTLHEWNYFNKQTFTDREQTEWTNEGCNLHFRWEKSFFSCKHCQAFRRHEKILNWKLIKNSLRHSFLLFIYRFTNHSVVEQGGELFIAQLNMQILFREHNLC